MALNQELKTVVLLLWELKIQKMKMVIPAVTTVNMEVKRLSMRVRREIMMKAQREVWYHMSMKRSLVSPNHFAK
jgi:hypothetical protein